MLAAMSQKRQGLLKSYLQTLISNILKVDSSEFFRKNPLIIIELDLLSVVDLGSLLQKS